jgi:carbonic anhydrase/acetyltransferase-like protein (isoleucine patch superfamily)
MSKFSNDTDQSMMDIYMTVRKDVIANFEDPSNEQVSQIVEKVKQIVTEKLGYGTCKCANPACDTSSRKDTKSTDDKFVLTDEFIIHEMSVLHRIKAVKDFNDVKAGDLGGWVGSERCLSHLGNAWVYDDAKVFENARVRDDAVVRDNAQVSGDAWVDGKAKVIENAAVFGNAKVTDRAVVRGNAIICGHTKVSGSSKRCCCI